MLFYLMVVLLSCYCWAVHLAALTSMYVLENIRAGVVERIGGRLAQGDLVYFWRETMVGTRGDDVRSSPHVEAPSRERAERGHYRNTNRMAYLC